MFEKLVVSSNTRAKRTTARFFLGTSALYVLAATCAVALSVVVSDPKLADTSDITYLPRLPLGKGDVVSDRSGPKGPPKQSTQQNFKNVIKLDTLLNRGPAPPETSQFGQSSKNASGGPAGGKEGPGWAIGVIKGDPTVEAPPIPDPPKPKPAAVSAPVDNKPVPLTSSVLQGKAIERRTPPYPHIPKQMRLQDSVSVEVVISPEGRVESARAISGHPLFRQAAEEAARGWRFTPTKLNGVPVRVTGVITFVFKLS